MPKLYATTLRPASGGGLPPGTKWSWVYAPWGQSVRREDGQQATQSNHRYGVVRIERELTPEELTHFDIVEVKG